MLILTNKDRQKRLDELQKPDIDRLMKKASHEGKGGSAQYQLYRRYGITGDFDPSITGNEWGEERGHDER